MMKKLFVAFMVLGFLASSGAWGENMPKSVKSENKITGAINSNVKSDQNFIFYAYDNVMKLVKKTTGSIKNTAFNKMHSFMNNGIIYSLLGLIIFFWLYKQMGKGGISKEEAFKALNFTIIFIIVYVILGSKTAFNEIIRMFKLPSLLLQDIFGGQDTTKNAITTVFGKPFMETFNVFGAIFQDIMDAIDLWLIGPAVSLLLTPAVMLLYLLYIGIALAVMIGVVVIQSYSIFLEGIYTIFAPIVILLLVIPQTKSIFFAWLKSYIGITLYVPLSGIAIKILSANPAPIPTGQQATYAMFLFSMTGIFLAILAISILTKIPTWISELLGVGPQGVGAGGAVGMARMAGDAVGKAGMAGAKAMSAGGKAAGGAAASAGKAIGNRAGNLASNLANHTKGGQAISNAVNKASSAVGSAVSNSAIGRAASATKNGFNAFGQWANKWTGSKMEK